MIRRDCADYGLRSDAGVYGYFYAFSDYEPRMGDVTYSARRYADSWNEVSLADAEGCSWNAVPYDDQRFVTVAKYFWWQEDVEEVYALGSSEEPLDPKRFGD